MCYHRSVPPQTAGIEMCPEIGEIYSLNNLFPSAQNPNTESINKASKIDWVTVILNLSYVSPY